MKTTLVLIITTRCNFKCIHCLREYYTKQYDLSLSLLKKTFLEAKELGFKHIALTGGEPILYPKFNELIDLICSFDFTWSIVTNGSMYKKYDSSIDKYKDKLKFITLSLDGGTEITHDTIRQKGSFKKVCDAAKYYKEKKIFIRLGFTLTSINLDEVPKFIQLALNLKVDAIRISGIIPTGYNKHLQVIWQQKVTIYQYIQKLKQQKLPLEISNTTSLFTETDEKKFCSNINDHEPAINAYGDYIFCCDTIGQGAVLGSLKKESFTQLFIKGLKEAAWLKEERRKQILNNAYFKDFNSCHYCNLMLENKLKRQKEYELSNKLIVKTENSDNTNLKTNASQDVISG